MIRAPELVCKSLGFQPEGAPATAPSTCSACGSSIAIGSPLIHYPLSIGFNDVADLSRRDLGGVRMCGWCPPLFAKNNMMLLLKCYITEDGVFGLAKNSERKHFWRNLPQKPFVVLWADSQLQHLAWRTPVSVSPEHVYVRVGSRILTVNVPKLLSAADAALRIMDLHEKEKGKRPWSIFVTSDSDISDVANCELRHDVERTARAQAPQDLALIKSLSLGELWALPVLLRGDVAPEPSTKKTLKNKIESPA